MPDVMTPAARSSLMAKIRHRGSKAERAFRAFLDLAGVPYTYQPRLHGRPDFLLPNKVVVFIDSDFWHGTGEMPASNVAFWKEKLAANRARDREVTERLASQGFVVVRLPEKAFARQKIVGQALARVGAADAPRGKRARGIGAPPVIPPAAVPLAGPEDVRALCYAALHGSKLDEGLTVREVQSSINNVYRQKLAARDVRGALERLREARVVSRSGEGKALRYRARTGTRAASLIRRAKRLEARRRAAARGGPLRRPRTSGGARAPGTGRAGRPARSRT